MIHVHRRSFPGYPAFDTAVSRALLAAVASGRSPESLRLHRPDDVLAFSVQDRTRPGFAAAVAAAREAGFAPILRLAGGRAAVFHRETLAFAWSAPARDARRGVLARFDATAGLVAGALRKLGVDARIGEVPGEYCPGSHSVNARGRRKLMGVGQRLVRGGAHVGGVIVVRDADRVREVLAPVYRALDLPFDPGTVGSVEDEVGPVSREDVAQALLSALPRPAAPAELAADLLAHAEALAPEHDLASGLTRCPGSSGSAAPDLPSPG